jgi:sulfur-oxidizing protein SoxB
MADGLPAKIPKLLPAVVKSMRLKISLRSFLSGCLIFVACSQTAVAERIRIISTNDIHSYLRPIYYRYQDELKPWGMQSMEGDYLQKTQLEGKVGGMAYAASVIKRLRAESPNSLLIDSGDTWHGSGLSHLDQGVSMVKIMNAMSYDAMVPGNWEYIYPKEQFLDLVDQSEFPVIAYNLFDKDWGDPVLEQYIIKKVGDLRIAIVGMTYPWTALTSSVFGAAQHWEYGIREAEAKALIAQIKTEENADLVVFISHAGYGYDQKFAQRVDGIDVLISGHTHNAVFDPVVWNNTIIYESGAHAEYVSSLDLEVKDKKVIDYDYQLIKVNQSFIEADAEIEKLIDEAYKPHSDKLDEVVGKADGMFYRRDYWQSTLGNLITDAMRKQLNVDISMFPAWRYGATLMPGKIRVEDIYNIIPTGGKVVTYSMSGKKFRVLLENVMDSVVSDDAYSRVGGDMIRFSGVKIVYDLNNASGNRIVTMNTVDGKPFEADRQYSIASVSTRFQNNPLFGASNIVETGKVFADELISYIRANTPISASLDDRMIPLQEGS